MTRALVYKLRTTGLWAAQCPNGHTYVTASWDDAMHVITHLMKEKP